MVSVVKDIQVQRLVHDGNRWMLVFFRSLHQVSTVDTTDISWSCQDLFNIISCGDNIRGKKATRPTQLFPTICVTVCGTLVGLHTILLAIRRTLLVWGFQQIRQQSSCHSFPSSQQHKRPDYTHLQVAHCRGLDHPLAVCLLAPVVLSLCWRPGTDSHCETCNIENVLDVVHNYLTWLQFGPLAIW